MEAQLQRSYGTHEEQSQLPRVSEGGEVEHHEKKSMLKKVKAKAKKIKESIKHLGHDHDQEHDDHDQEEEEDDDEEMVDAPEVHGAPIYESSALKSGVVPHQDAGMGPKPVGIFEHPSSKKEGGLDSNVSSEDNMKRFLQTVGEGRKDTAMADDHEHGGLERTEREPGARFGALTGSQEHPHAPMEKLDNPSNHQSKVTHPQTAQGVEPGVAPLVASFGKMSVEGETKPNSRRHDSSNANVTEDDDSRRFTHPIRETAMGVDHSPVEHYSHVPPPAHHGETETTEPKFGGFPKLQEDRQSPMDTPNPSNYQSKVSDPTGQRAEEAGMPPLVASIGKMTVEDETKPSSIHSATDQKSSYTGSHDQFSPQALPTSTQFPPESTPKHFDSAKPEEGMPIDTIDEKPSPAQGATTYTEKLSSAAYVIADKAVSAKNAVASKLGYGGGNVEEGTHTKSQDKSATDLGYGETHTESQNQAPTGYAQRATAAVTDTLAPIYGKVAGVGSAVASKVPGIGTTGKEGQEGISETHTKPQNDSPTGNAQKSTAAVTDTLAPIYGKVAGVGSAVVSKVPGIGTTGKEGEEGISETSMNENKGRGGNMKEYIAEKLRPGEEDKALSEVITDSLNVQKEKPTEGMKPIEKVTESEDVTRRLGTGQENPREGSDALVSGSESSGNTMVDKIKDAVTSWVTKGGESPTSHQGAPAASSENMEASKN